MYFAVGIGLIVIMIVLLLINKFAPYSEFMSSFKKGTYKTLMIGLSVGALLSISYGVYHALTYQPPFIDIQTSEGDNTVFGDIGSIGYYADGLVKKDQEADITLVSWEELSADDELTITIKYPSGKEEVWQSPVTQLNNSTFENLNTEYDVKGMYDLEPHTFDESGDVKLIIDNNDSNISFTIDVKAE